MAYHALFAGLIFDEKGQPVASEHVGTDMFYVVDDDGFRRFVESELIDREIMKLFTDQIAGNEDFLSEQAATMMGKDDLFSKAILKNQMLNVDKHLDDIFKVGIPEEARAYLGMMGMRIVVNFRGEIVDVQLPSRAVDEE